MASVNVQFRMDPEVVRYVEAHGVKAGQLAKEAFEREVHRMRAAENAKQLAALRIKLPKGFAERVVREMRDSR